MLILALLNTGNGSGSEEGPAGLADSAGLDEGTGVGTDDGAGLAAELAELEER